MKDLIEFLKEVESILEVVCSIISRLGVIYNLLEWLNII